MAPSEKSNIRLIFSLPVIVAALGYFVDIYDLVLFSIVRVPSLKAIGLDGQDLVDKGVFLLNMQMIGMLLGGILWGILGDRKGRLKIMFASIFIYSVANFANGFANSLPVYAVLRFIAGIGLAGELGAGITLVAEVLPKHIRGYGTMMVASIGVSGAILANWVATSFDWRTAFYIGGGLGMLLLITRISVAESGMFQTMEVNSSVSKGNFLALFTNGKRFLRYLNSVLIGVPIWYVVAILITFSPEFAKEFGITGPISAGNAVMLCYLGLIFGDFSSGLLSQILKSRKKAVLIFMILTVAGITFYFLQGAQSTTFFYGVCFTLGVAGGYWAIFVTVAAEQFGTNLRATVATTVPNFVRGMVVPITIAFQFLKNYMSMEASALTVGAVCLIAAFLSLAGLEETFSKDLDYFEENI
ncbi:MAG: MFS transporter [Bdellovibrionales bacterium RIFOXYD12_FULL_39_22]|nr:MAG: MFS transporter [Bdellovibrionales bacterium RIFOXYB1_FULL_39_21]OFZ44348.1 MAG: MFS transporter [Bdellovibrionales bacterium RIFOXYC12_FULL_39_17]OFZ49203.1 MAG: MFS transporter [Bdellovibrionales bacterium RIFOXYC1_FULL_39_130]OFZ77011.1 MAG: MFS transporter [Bdellovibrionales bacterium RIFOXYD1_FULL_39_84]OFZ95224.1 MAG: MFS transporter [Bdellovibrionales bacterium RIFOXYD12_FULL_39_22]HLE09622.1 MFS transporter [Bacteriovoracaceae bacterium]